MKYLISILTLLTSTTLSANESPIKQDYKCLDYGCSIACLNRGDKWTTLSSGATKVSVKRYQNSNIEFTLKHKKNSINGEHNKEIIFIGKDNLQCKLNGIVSE